MNIRSFCWLFGDVGNIASGSVSGCGDVSDRNVFFDWVEVDSSGMLWDWVIEGKGKSSVNDVDHLDRQAI